MRLFGLVLGAILAAQPLHAEFCSAFNPSPKDEAEWKHYYETEQVDLEDTYQFAKKLVEDDAKRERAEADRKRNEASDRQAAFNRAVAMTNRSLKQCGFTPHFELRADSDPGSNKLDMTGYDADVTRSVQYNFPAATTMEEFKVSLMIARTCADVEAGALSASHGMPEHVDPPCNDGLDILNAHADDPAFLDAIAAQSTMIQGWTGGVPTNVSTRDFTCVARTVRKLRLPVNEEQYKHVFAPVIERNVRWNKAAGQAEKRRQAILDWNREQEASNPGPAPIRRSTPQPGPCHWITNSLDGSKVLWCD